MENIEKVKENIKFIEDVIAEAKTKTTTQEVALLQRKAFEAARGLTFRSDLICRDVVRTFREIIHDVAYGAPKAEAEVETEAEVEAQTEAEPVVEKPVETVETEPKAETESKKATRKPKAKKA